LDYLFAGEAGKLKSCEDYTFPRFARDIASDVLGWYTVIIVRVRSLASFNAPSLFCLQEGSRRKLMKKLKHLCAATVLALTLTLSAFAGEMSSPGIKSSSSPQESSAAGDIGMPGATAAGEILTPGLSGLDPVTEAALGLLDSLLSLF
jgi:hypothetical protein